MKSIINEKPSTTESTDSVLSLQARLRDWEYLGRLITRRTGATAHEAIREYEKQEDALRGIGLRAKR